MNRFKYRNWWVVVGVIAFLPIISLGQAHAGSVTIKGGVSEIVALSLGQVLPQHNLRIDSQGDLKTLTLTLTGSGTDVAEVRLPILIRSNTGYDVSAHVRSQAATLADFLVLDVHPIGRFVAADALSRFKLARELDNPATNGGVQTTAPNFFAAYLSAPSSIFRGPRVSLSGTLNSADNALEVIMLISVKPDVGASSWNLNLTLSASADRF